MSFLVYELSHTYICIALSQMISLIPSAFIVMEWVWTAVLTLFYEIADCINAGMSIWALGGGADLASLQGKCKQSMNWIGIIFLPFLSSQSFSCLNICQGWRRRWTVSVISILMAWKFGPNIIKLWLTLKDNQSGTWGWLLGIGDDGKGGEVFISSLLND
jgi:hypothetical protein